jgi:hypothetical protein
LKRAKQQKMDLGNTGVLEQLPHRIVASLTLDTILAFVIPFEKE